MVAVLFVLREQSCGSGRLGLARARTPVYGQKRTGNEGFLLEIETQHYFVELALTSGKAFPVITKLCFGMEKIKATTAEADMRASSP